MSVTTWTPTALASEFVGWEGSGWRAVEAQHKVATMGLVHGNVEAQSLLEDILEEAKPKLPPEVEGLHWLLATPFRYWPLPGGSRFRRPADPGVFYGAEERETACAEAGYWRLQFWNESEFLSQQSKSISVTLFEFHVATQKALDLTKLPLVSDREIWVRTDDYTETQRLAENARQAGAEMIRYESVRLPKGRCLAILLSKAFSSVTDPFRNNQQTWSLLINPPRQVVWQRELSQECWTFVF